MHGLETSASSRTRYFGLVIWSKGTTISPSDIQQALLPHKHSPENILDRPLVNLQLNDVLSEVARHYLRKPLRPSNGNKVESCQASWASELPELSLIG